jgi:Zn-dependent peptidase ImmA (M78 family)
MDAWLERRSGHANWKVALDSLVHRRFFSGESDPPVDVIALAQELGFQVVIDDVLAGRLELDSYPRTIRIPRSSSPRRQRFALAHEIAHILFLVESGGVFRSVFDGQLGQFDNSTRDSSDRLEQYCDVAARAILIPSIVEDISERLLASITCIDQLIRLARRFDVSPIVAFHRMLDVNRSALFKGSMLLKFCANRHTGRHEKWRLVSPTVVDTGKQRIRLWENKSLEKLGVYLPAPDTIGSAVELMPSVFQACGRRWQFVPQWDCREPDLILARFERSDDFAGAPQRTLF